MNNSAVLAFDIETVPDAQLLKQHYETPDVEDAKIIERAAQDALKKSDGRSDFLPLVFHRVVTISYVNYADDQLSIVSLAHPEHNEKQALDGFFRIFERQSPLLVSWNGSGFDLPVLLLRAVQHGVATHGFWNGPPGINGASTPAATTTPIRMSWTCCRYARYVALPS